MQLAKEQENLHPISGNSETREGSIQQVAASGEATPSIPLISRSTPVKLAPPTASRFDVIPDTPETLGHAPVPEVSFCRPRKD